MTSSIDMTSNALVLIGDDPINALSEDVAAENLYLSVYENVLSQHPWSFALKEQYLSRLTAEPDRETGYRYAFQIPPDCIVMWAVMPVSDYRIVGKLLYANANKLLARYIYRVDETQLPAYFVKVMEYKLASEFSMSVAEDVNKMQVFNQMYVEALGQAMAKDSQQSPYEGIMRNPIRNRRSRR